MTLKALNLYFDYQQVIGFMWKILFTSVLLFNLFEHK